LREIFSVFYDNLDTSDPNDPEVIIKIDKSNGFNTICRALTLDVLSGRASRDYACGLKHGEAIPTCENLSNLFGYFKAMRSSHAKLRYLDWDGQVRLAKGKTAGQQAKIGRYSSWLYTLSAPQVLPGHSTLIY
jgi:hypothetical protein